jgi:hypothetical protein
MCRIGREGGIDGWQGLHGDVLATLFDPETLFFAVYRNDFKAVGEAVKQCVGHSLFTFEGTTHPSRMFLFSLQEHMNKGLEIK